MRNAIVVDNKRHGAAMIGWLQLPLTDWDIVLYGEPLEDYYSEACLVRPIGPILDSYAVWVKHELRPRVFVRISSIGLSPLEVRTSRRIEDKRPEVAV